MTKNPHVNKYKKEAINFYFTSQAKLDFHILNKFDAFEIERMLNEFLEDSYVQKLDFVTIVVGKGNVIRPYVRKLLSVNSYVKEFAQASYFNGQSGAFEVIIKS